jgi:hypothetical protein
MRRFFGLGRVGAFLVTIAFLAGSIGFGMVLPPDFLNGSGAYLPALAAILIVGVLVARGDPRTGRLILSAGAIFVVSVTFRSIDMLVCPYFPLGTHFIWHLLNALTLYVLLATMMRAASRPGVG